MTRLSAATTRILIILALIICIGMPAAVCAAEGDSPAPEVTYTDTGEPVTVTDVPEELGLPSGAIEDASKSDSDFALKRLLVFTDQTLTDSHGAVSLTYYDYAQEYILDYATEEDTEAAYNALVQEYGRKNVIVDFVFQSLAEDETADSDSDDAAAADTTTESANTEVPQTPALQAAARALGQMFTNTSAMSVSWGADAMQLDTARDRVESDTSMTDTVTVAVLDGGIYPEHELFTGRLLTDQAASCISEYKWYEDTTSGHGTHVAGIIADSTPTQVKILPVKIMDANGNASFDTFLHGIYHALNSGADIINLSFDGNLKGTPYENNSNYINSVKALTAADQSGCICIAASGNKDIDIDEKITFPACSPYTIAVGSVQTSDGSYSRYTSSNYGDSLDFTAPGVNVLSAAITGLSDYEKKGGTSMAAPHITAAFAMLRLYHKDASKAELMSLMQVSALDLGSAGKDPYYGYGMPIFTGGAVPGSGMAPIDNASVYPDPENSQQTVATTPASQQIGASTAAQQAASRQAASRQAAAQRAYTAKVNRAKAKKVTSFKAKAVKSRKAKLRWKASGVTGYQVKYGLGKKLKKAKTKTVTKKKLTLKKLKAGKTYYVKVRPYTQLRTPAGKIVKIYGKWSKAKKVKVRK